MNIKKSTVAIDLDNTLNSLTLEYITYADYHFGWKMKAERSNRHFQWYDLGEYFPDDTSLEEIQDTTNIIFSDYNFWIGIEPHKDAYELVNRLYHSNKYNIKIVTYPWKFKEGAVKGKQDWIKKHFSFINKKDIIFQHDKWNGDYDIVIDDNVEILNKCFEANMHILKYFHFYNIHAKCHQSFRDILPIADYLENDYKEVLYEC